LTIEVTEAELQAVLNTLKNTTSGMHIKNCRRSGNSADVHKGTTSRLMVASKPTVFDKMAAPVPEMMGSSLYACST
jgi:hypothetical protein